MDKENSSQDDQEPTDELNSEELHSDPIDSFSEEFSPGELAEDREEENSLASIIKNDTLDGLDTEEGSLIGEDLVEEMLSDDSEIEEEEEESTNSLPPEKDPLLETEPPGTSSENLEATRPTPASPIQEQAYSFSNQPTLIDDIPPSNEAVETPSSIGPYKIEGKLDRGGMSILYLGVHPDTQEAITVKVLLPKYLDQPKEKVPEARVQPGMKELGKELSQYFQTKVNIQAKPNGKGRIQIDFDSDNDLQRIISKFNS